MFPNASKLDKAEWAAEITARKQVLMTEKCGTPP
jgi:hypothetical protein